VPAIAPDILGCPEIVVEPDLVRGPKVFVAGEPVEPRRGRGRPVYPIPLAGGGEATLTLHGAFLGLRARIGERDYPLEPRLTVLELVVVVLPLVLVSVGGVPGAFMAAMGAMLNLVIVRRPWPLVARLAAAVLVVAGGLALLAILPRG
jgi:hypothetical protein